MRRITLLLCIFLVVISGMLAGCGEKQFTIERGKLLLGVDPDPPWLIRSGNTYEGYGIDVLNQVAAELGLEIGYVPAEYLTHVSDLDQHKFDIGGSPGVINAAHEKIQSFTIPVAETHRYVVVLKQSPVQKLEDLKEKILGVLEKTPDAELVKDYGVKEVRGFPDEDAMLAALDSGSVDAIIIPSVEYLYQNKNGDKYSGVVKVGEPLTWGFAVRKGNTELLDPVNEVLENMEKDGSLESLQKKWLD